MNNDLISRKALKKQFGYTDEWYKSRTVTQIIDNAPTVDINTELSVAYLKGRRQGQSEERPTGEWIVQRLQNGFEDVYCPFCKARPTRSEYGYYLKDKFCHECGADMRKGEKE